MPFITNPPFVMSQSPEVNENSPSQLLVLCGRSSTASAFQRYMVIFGDDSLWEVVKSSCEFGMKTKERELGHDGEAFKTLCKVCIISPDK